MTTLLSLQQSGRRILVVGTAGSGKTTLAHEIAQRLDIAHYELDALHWGPNWTSTPIEEMRIQIDSVIQGDAWVIDGNYSKTQALTMARADTLIWLDYALPITVWQLLKRTLRRAIRQEELWSGNRESLYKAFFTQDSILLYALSSYQRRRQQYSAILVDPANAHLRFIRLKSPREMQKWLDSIRALPHH